MGKRTGKAKLVLAVKMGLVAAMLGLAAYLGIRYAPYFKQLINDPSNIVQFRDFVKSFGAPGVVVLLLIQVLQVFFAVIPADPIELAAGMCYGGFWGFAVCSLGVLIGTFLLFSLVRRYGEPFVEAFIQQKHIKKFKFLENAKRLEFITFILYFIPGLPKDVFTYLAALTPIKPSRFFVISSIGRIPSILVTTIGGANLMKGNVVSTAVLFGVFGAVGIVGMIVYRIVTRRMDQKREQAQSEEDPQS